MKNFTFFNKCYLNKQLHSLIYEKVVIFLDGYILGCLQQSGCFFMSDVRVLFYLKLVKCYSVYTNLEFLKKNVKEESNEYSCKGICLMVHTVLQYKKTCWKNLIVKEYLEIE